MQMAPRKWGRFRVKSFDESRIDTQLAFVRFGDTRQNALCGQNKASYGLCVKTAKPLTAGFSPDGSLAAL